jgi:S1-C subfamily serine protease
MRIDEVVDDSIAAKARLLAGDKILKIGETPVADREELRVAMQESPTKSKVVVMRGTEVLEFEIEFPIDLDAPIRKLGMRVDDDLQIQRVTRDEVAAKAGLERDDVITSVDGMAVKTKAEFSAAIGAAKGDVKIEARRGEGDKATSVSAVLRLAEGP